MDRPIRPVEFDDRVLAVPMDSHALSFRAERARRACKSIVVKVIFGHCWSRVKGAERWGEAMRRVERDRRI